MADVRQEDSELVNVRVAMIDEDKEKDETDEGSDEDEEAKEESFAGADTVHPGVCDHFAGSHTNSIIFIVTPVSGLTISMRGRAGEGAALK